MATPLQYSCLENPMDRGSWWATVYGVTESDTTQHVLTSIGEIGGGKFFIDKIILNTLNKTFFKVQELKKCHASVFYL